MNSKTVLIVEDEEVIGEMIQEIVRCLLPDMEIFWANSISSARKKLEGMDPIFILLDSNLPDGKGYELAREIREKGNEEVRII